MIITQKEINDILLKRKLNDFYIAITERKNIPFTDEDIDDLLTNINNVSTRGLRELDIYFLKSLKEGYDKYNPKTREQAKGLLERYRTRKSSIFTIIDGELYDVASQDCKSRFFDQTHEMIVHYDNFSKIINEKEAKFVLKKPDSKTELVFFNVEGRALSDLNRYIQFYFRKAGNTDLTSKLYCEAKQKIK